MHGVGYAGPSAPGMLSTGYPGDRLSSSLATREIWTAMATLVRCCHTSYRPTLTLGALLGLVAAEDSFPLDLFVRLSSQSKGKL